MSKQIESHGMRDSAVSGSGTGSWDPYEVWLNRVKKPREEQAVSTQTFPPVTATTQTVKVAVDLSETARLRALRFSASG